MFNACFNYLFNQFEGAVLSRMSCHWSRLDMSSEAHHGRLVCCSLLWPCAGLDTTKWQLWGDCYPENKEKPNKHANNVETKTTMKRVVKKKVTILRLHLWSLFFILPPPLERCMLLKYSCKREGIDFLHIFNNQVEDHVKVTACPFVAPAGNQCFQWHILEQPSWAPASEPPSLLCSHRAAAGCQGSWAKPLALTWASMNWMSRNPFFPLHLLLRV